MRGQVENFAEVNPSSGIIEKTYAGTIKVGLNENDLSFNNESLCSQNEVNPLLKDPFTPELCSDKSKK